MDMELCHLERRAVEVAATVDALATADKVWLGGWGYGCGAGRERQGCKY